MKQIPPHDPKPTMPFPRLRWARCWRWTGREWQYDGRNTGGMTIGRYSACGFLSAQASLLRPGDVSLDSDAVDSMAHVAADAYYCDRDMTLAEHVEAAVSDRVDGPGSPLWQAYCEAAYPWARDLVRCGREPILDADAEPVDGHERQVWCYNSAASTRAETCGVDRGGVTRERLRIAMRRAGTGAVSSLTPPTNPTGDQE